MNARFRLVSVLGCAVRRNYAQPRFITMGKPVVAPKTVEHSFVNCTLTDLCRPFATSSGKPTPGTKKTDAKEEAKRAPDTSDSSDSGSDSDSSSSDEEGVRGESPFWRQKMRTHHHAIDVNKDGTVSWDDFEMLAQRFETLGNLEKAQAEAFRSVLRDFWEEYWGASTDPYAFVMQEDFLKSMHHVVNTPSLRKKVAKPLPYFFRAVDHDGSGEISVEEYKLFFKCLGMSEADAVNSFNAIDTNQDGKLSLEEFVRLGRDFFISENETGPSKYFWGPLVA